MTQITHVAKLKPLKSPGLWLPVMFVLATGSLLVITVFVILAYQVVYLNRVYPGVWIAGTDVGGLSQPEVIAAINQRAPEYLAQSVILRYDNQVWTFTGEQLGMRVDVAATANAAHNISRTGNLIADLFTQLRLMREPRNIEPVILYDTGPTNQVLQDLAEQINRPPRDAQLIIHPDARVEVISPEWGRRMSLEATQPLIEAALFKSDGQPVVPVVQQIIPNISEVEPARQQAENLLSQPLIFRFRADDNSVTEWRLEPRAMVDLIEVVETVNDNGKTQFFLQLKPDKFTPYFEQMAQAINRESVDAQLHFDPETAELTVLKPSQDGRTLDTEATFERVVALQEQRPAHLVDLPVTVIPPSIPSTDLDRLGIKEMVAEATSYFKGSSESRMKNIAVAAAKFQGVIVPPGEIFSFNEHLGPVTKEAGFDEGLIIQGNRTSVGLGGGVCQVSTTAFRVAFLGGYEIVERWAHGYRVGWYEINSVPGLDATVYSPDIDFKFRNDTDYYLLIQTESDLEAGTVTFRIYSTRTNREVTVSEPEKSNLVKHGPPIYEPDPKLPRGAMKQVDWAVDGLDVLVKRTVKEGDKVIHQDEVFSHYEPWRAVYKVGPRR
jgi:vancomycin resistance protein YoaR